jgi:hypothetical protein
MADQVWHGTKKCAINGAKIPRDLQIAGKRCPFCGNTLGANFDGTAQAGFDSPSAPTAQARPTSNYVAAVGIFVGVNIAVSLIASFVISSGAARGALALILGAVAAWWYLQSR